MNWPSNPELVRAYLTSEQPRPDWVARCDEEIFVVVARCTCGWYDYFRTLDESSSDCPRCKLTLPEAFIG